MFEALASELAPQLFTPAFPNCLKTSVKLRFHFGEDLPPAGLLGGLESLCAEVGASFEINTSKDTGWHWNDFKARGMRTSALAAHSLLRTHINHARPRC